MRTMLDGMSVHAWRDWQVYMALAPFTEERADVRAAQICQTFVNMWRDTKENPKPIPLDDFIIKFGDSAKPVAPEPEKPQTVEEMERNISDWVAGSNQILAEERARGQRR